MGTQLQDLIAKSGNNHIEVKGYSFHKNFEVGNFTGDSELMLASFKSVRATYDGMLLPKCRVLGHPQAEVWEVFGKRGQKVVRFAVDQGQIRVLA